MIAMWWSSMPWPTPGMSFTSGMLRAVRAATGPTPDSMRSCGVLSAPVVMTISFAWMVCIIAVDVSLYVTLVAVVPLKLIFVTYAFCISW